MTQRITVAIPHRGDGRIHATLRSLYDQTFLPSEIIIGSDTSVGVADPDHSKPELRQFTNLTNNASIKRNICAAHAKGELVAFTDPDCIPDKDWLENAVKYFDNQMVIGVEGLIYSDRSKGNLAPRFQKGTYMTANIIYRRWIFDRIEFDPLLGSPPPHGEDTDFGYRALRCGTIVSAEDVKVYHEPKYLPTAGLLKQYILTRSKHVPLSKKWKHEFREVIKNEEKQNPLYLIALLYGSMRYGSLAPLPFALKHISFKRIFSDLKLTGIY